MFDLILDSAVLGAHIQKSAAGFRQRDVRFLVDLSWNWQSSLVGRARLEKVHNTQIQRFLRKLVADAWANTSLRSDPPRFRLTRAGFLGLVRGLREHALKQGFDEFLFVRYFLESYRERIVSLTEKEGAPMPLSFRQELNELLDARDLLRRRIQSTEKEIAYWGERIRETREAVAFTRKELAKGRSWEQAVQALERAYPYELNYQKPLAILFRETPEDMQRWEIFEGNPMRIDRLWLPLKENLEGQLKLLQGMRTG